MTAPLTISSYASEENDYYNDCRLLVKLSDGTLHYGIISNYQGPIRVLTVQWDDSTLTSSDGGTDDQTEYTIYFPIGNIGDFDVTNPPEVIINGVFNEDVFDKRKGKIIPNIGTSSYSSGVFSGKITDFHYSDGGYGYNEIPSGKIPKICKTSWSSSSGSSGSSGSLVVRGGSTDPDIFINIPAFSSSFNNPPGHRYTTIIDRGYFNGLRYMAFWMNSTNQVIECRFVDKRSSRYCL